MSNNLLPFQYPIRAATVEQLPDEERIGALEQRDRELEDFLGSIEGGGGGEPGPPGPQGPAGVGVPAGGATGQVLAKNSATNYDTGWVDAGTGGGGPVAFVFNQGTPLATWTINHALPFQPNVTAIDSSKRQIEGDVVYSTGTTVQITFSAAVSGIAYLS